MKVKTVAALFAGLLLWGSVGETLARPWRHGYGHRRRRGPVIVLPIPRKRRPKPVVVVNEPVVKRVIIPASYETIHINGVRFHYRGGRFYKLRGDRLVQVRAPRGAVVSNLPTARKLEIVNGKLFYVVGQNYYRKALGGYRVVKHPYRLVKSVPVVETIIEPVEKRAQTENMSMSIPESAVVEVPEASASSTTSAQNSTLHTKYTTWLKNANGSKTPVELTRHPSGSWIGPKGEHYDEIPTEEQLRVMYGL